MTYSFFYFGVKYVIVLMVSVRFALFMENSDNLWFHISILWHLFISLQLGTITVPDVLLGCYNCIFRCMFKKINYSYLLRFSQLF